MVINSNTAYSWSDQGGFITFPAASYQADPQGVIAPGPPSSVAAVTQTSPVLPGAGSAPFYDLAMKRWIPAGPGQAAPDGRSYAYIDPVTDPAPTHLHVVQVSSGSDHAISIPALAPFDSWALEDFDGRIAYLTVAQLDVPARGVWTLDTATGVLRQVLSRDVGHVRMVQNGVVWLGKNNPADPAPPSYGLGSGEYDTLFTINLATGASRTWLYKPGADVMLFGLDESQHPVVWVRPPPFINVTVPLNILPAPGKLGVAIFASFETAQTMEPDGSRLWFGGDDGIYFWSTATGLLRVFHFQQPSQTIAPAGHCA